MIKYLNGQPVEHGDIVHIKNHAYFVSSTYPSSGVITVTSMDETREQKRVFPKDIGAYWDNVHPLFKNILEGVRP
jgi:hypothetical protein